MAEDPSSFLSQRKVSCSNFPDFATVCLFIEQFGDILGLLPLNIDSLKEGFEDVSEDGSDLIKELHVYLLRRIKKNVPIERWERELVKFCSSYNPWHGWELEEKSYCGLKLSTKLAIIRNLLEAQFDANLRFQERLKSDIPEEELRNQCYGRDKQGLCYWLIQDEALTLNIYRVDQDDTDGASWQIVAKDRDELEVLISCLKEGNPVPCCAGGIGGGEDHPRSDTPLSVLSVTGGTAAWNRSRTATPTKFAFERSITNTPVKSQLASCTETQEATEAPVAEEKTESAVCKTESADGKAELADAKTETADVIGDIKQEDSDIKEVEGDRKAEIKDMSGDGDSSMKGVGKQEESKVHGAGGEGDCLVDRLKGEIDTNIRPVNDEKNVTASTTAVISTAADGEEMEQMSFTEKHDGSSPVPLDNQQEMIEEIPTADTSALGDPLCQPAVDKEKEPMGSHNSTDSEDNVPLSQLKQSCVLLNKARRSLLKAKKKHERKKYKELIKKRKEKGTKRTKPGGTTEGTDSPKSASRSSGRQRRPVVNEFNAALVSAAASDSSDLGSDSDDDIPLQGRNARRQAKRTGRLIMKTTHEELSSEVDNDDTPCVSCLKYNQPHLILLCDKCDRGWHTGCVKPPLFYIPDGDWHCPHCEHERLVGRLEEHLVKLDILIKNQESKKKRQERQEKYALANGINPSNIISDDYFDPSPSKVHRDRKEKFVDEYAYDSWEEDHYVPSKRSCRQRPKVSYNFEEYEAMISSAIRTQNGDDPTILPGTNSTLVPTKPGSTHARPPPGRSRGKDISNLLGEAGSNLPGSSEEEETADANNSEEEEEGLKSKGKENKDVKAASTTKKRRSLNKLNDMDADSAGEADDDYAMSDEAEDEDDKSGVSEESLSDDWRPSGQKKKGSRSRRRRGARRQQRSHENINSFICDEEEDSDLETKRRKRQAPPRRQTRTSASATQAAVRAKRADFGFTSSEESLATTPCSSSAEEEAVVAKRRVNKWNAIKTYSGRDSAQSDKPPKRKKTKKTKRRVKRDYNSDQSTEQESSDSGEEYIPADDPTPEPHSVDNPRSDEGNSDEEGCRRVNNRLESSTDEEDNKANNEDINGVSNTELGAVTDPSTGTSNTNLPRTQDCNKVTKGRESQGGGRTHSPPPDKVSCDKEIDDKTPPAPTTVIKPEATNTSDSQTLKKRSHSAADPATSSCPSKSPLICTSQESIMVTKATPGEALPEVASSGCSMTISVEDKTSSSSPVVANGNSNNNNSTGLASAPPASSQQAQRPLLSRPIATYPMRPHHLGQPPSYPVGYQYPGASAYPSYQPPPGQLVSSPSTPHSNSTLQSMPIRPVPRQATSASLRMTKSGPEMIRPVNGQQSSMYYHPGPAFDLCGNPVTAWSHNPYTHNQPVPSNSMYPGTGGGPYSQLSPHQLAGFVNPAHLQPQPHAPPPHGSHPHSSSPHGSQPHGLHQPPPHSSSSTFMVDSLLQSESSRKEGSELEGGGGGSAIGVASMGEPDEEDEMSSYMAMASSIVTGSAGSGQS